ncbi:MAG: sigma-54-dependent Fis family transcriptional regulator, partial [Proteobacteria bacterium]|nr:sigma-54-dependent Fis family transcriptional regulator [Pseudomonadota bacterium]
SDGIATFQKSPFDMVVTDLKMEAMDGIEVVKRIRSHQPDAVVMVVSGFGTIETAVAAMREGAFDFIEKPFSPEVLRAKVEKGLEVASTRKTVLRLSAENEALQTDVKRQKGTQLVGTSEPIAQLLDTVQKAAATSATVHIHGESGTGKELIARMVHNLSPRSHGPFVVVHCAALAESLLESELFGHEKGSFTGASKRKLGRFELADGGTIFLDEIGDISPSTQTKLLRVLQEREIQRVGGEETLKVDVRVLSATHRDLKKEVESGRFREDLFYRLHIVPLHVPALRERPEDLQELAVHFIQKHAPKMNPRVKGISKNAVYALERYAWPGNVRELENVIEQTIVFAESDEIQEADLPVFLQSLPAPHSERLPVLRGDRPLPDVLDNIERQL